MRVHVCLTVFPCAKPCSLLHPPSSVFPMGCIGADLFNADLFRRCLGELHDLLRDDKLQDSIVIILANKQDVPDSLSAPEVNTIF